MGSRASDDWLTKPDTESRASDDWLTKPDDEGRHRVLSRDEAVRVLLDEAVARAIQAEALAQEPGSDRTTMDINRQSAEILKFIAEKL